MRIGRYLLETGRLNPSAPRLSFVDRPPDRRPDFSLLYFLPPYAPRVTWLRDASSSNRVRWLGSYRRLYRPRRPDLFRW